jgi:transcriptional regulator with XRE-family HTH domain
MSEEITRLLKARWFGTSGEGRRLRERAGLSLREEAEAIGVDPATLARWELGLCRPRTDAALRWEALLSQLQQAAA